MTDPYPIRRALVLGCGFTGRALTRALLREGAGVVATARSGPDLDWAAGAGAEPLVWTAPDALPDGLEADTAFVLFPPRGLDAEAVAALVGRFSRTVYLSSTSVYGDQGGREVTEDSPVSPISPWAFARVEAEQALRRVGAIVVRAGGIYGPGRNIGLRLRAGRVRNTGDPLRPVNLVAVDDLATILIAAARRAAPGSVHLGTDGLPIPWIELARAAAEATGLPLPPRTPMPTDANLRMFYSEAKRARPLRHGDLGVTLRWPDSRLALRAWLANSEGQP